MHQGGQVMVKLTLCPLPLVLQGQRCHLGIALALWRLQLSQEWAGGPFPTPRIPVVSSQRVLACQEPGSLPTQGSRVTSWGGGRGAGLPGGGGGTAEGGVSAPALALP